MNIEPGRIINDFIEPNKKQYAIPVYQRNYEWPENQCKKLFEDIVAAYDNETNHFCGSVVRKMIKEEMGVTHYVIIDGQQRLTTIFILIKALSDCAETEADKQELLSTLFNKDKYDELADDVSNKLKLKPIKSDDEQLRLLMEDKYDQIDKSSGLWNNYILFKQLIEEELVKGRYTKDIYRGIEKLNCAKISLDNEDNAQEIFERINSTGVPLSLADKVRNFVLMTEVDQERLYEEYWIDFEKLISKKQRSDYIITFLNMKIEGFVKESDAYDIFKDVFRKHNYTNESMLDELLHYAKYYHAFVYGDDKYSEKINECLDGLRRLKQTTAFVFLFEVFDDYEKGIIDTEELERVLQFLLNYSIRRIICEVGSNSLRGLYKTLYSRVFNKEENKEKYYDSLVSFFKQISSKDVLPTDELFEEALKYNNLYRKNALCKYLLVAIENQGKEKVETDTLTIEHVLPQNENMSVKWQEMLGENWREDKERFLHTLGNLTITGYNSELGDRAFIEKKEMLSSPDCKIVDLNKDIVDQEKWNKDAIKSRANRLIDDIERLFPIEEPEVIVSFEDSRYKMYTCEEPDNATSKYINYYVMQGEKIIVESFSEMLRSVIERLYEENPAIIELMATHNTPIFENSEKALFSYDEDAVQYPNKLGETGIYVSGGFSARSIMRIIRSLLDRYEIEYDDLVYSARSNVKGEK